MISFCLFRENFNAATLAEKAIEEGALAVIVEQPEFENKEKIFSMFRLLLHSCNNWPFITEADLLFLLLALRGVTGKQQQRNLFMPCFPKSLMFSIPMET